ncbi:hypothetical protein MTO96_011204 [Rhipicephalus appendiculatus]
MTHQDPLYEQRSFYTYDDEPEYGEVAYATVEPRKRTRNPLKRFVLGTFKPARSSTESHSKAVAASCVALFRRALKSPSDRYKDSGKRRTAWEEGTPFGVLKVSPLP